MHIYRPPAAPDRIPVIDLTPSFSGEGAAFDAVAQEIHKACREMGFFYVSHHRIPQDLIDATFKQSARFFALPGDQKKSLNMKNSPAVVGYETGEQQLDSQDDKSQKAPPDLKESFSFGMELESDHPWAQKKMRNYGHNQWPNELPGFHDVMLAYQSEIGHLSQHLMRLIARSLDLPANWFEPHFQMWSRSIRLLRYPPQPTDAKFNQIGAGAHTDWGALTILAQDDIGGLEVLNAGGQWVQATPVPGTFVINLGDLTARWTNGIYNANMHRVKNNSSGRDRFSIVSFNSPQPDTVIEPIPGCVTDAFPRKFPTCTAREHTQEMFRRSYGYTPNAAA